MRRPCAARRAGAPLGALMGEYELTHDHASDAELAMFLSEIWGHEPHAEDIQEYRCWYFGA